MKAVIIDTFNYFDFRTKYVYDELTACGCDVTMFVSDFEHLTKSKRSECRKDTVFLPTKPYFKNISLRRMQSHVDFAKQVYRHLCQLEPDFIYCLLPVNSLAKRVHMYKRSHKNTKVFFDIYDLWPESLPAGQMIKKLLFPWRNLRDKHLRCADKIFLECSYYKKYLPDCFDYTVAYLCKKKREVSFKHINDDTIRFLYLGSINNIIDINGIVKMLSKINKLRAVCLEIVGGGEAENELIDKLESADVPFVSHGRIFDESEKDEIVSRCHFGINIYKKGLCIGLTMKSLDYFCRGLPIINSNINDTENIINQTKCGINVDENITESIEKAVNEWEEMHGNCLNAYERFFSEDTFKNMLSRHIGDIA